MYKWLKGLLMKYLDIPLVHDYIVVYSNIQIPTEWSYQEKNPIKFSPTCLHLSFITDLNGMRITKCNKIIISTVFEQHIDGVSSELANPCYTYLSFVATYESNYFLIYSTFYVCYLWIHVMTSSNENTWWRHHMKTFSALQALCAGNSPVTGEFPAQRPVTRSFDVFFDLRLNKLLSKQSWGRWSETQSSPLWRHSNDFPRYWPFVWGIHRSPSNSLHKGQSREALMFPMMCTWTNGWVNNRDAGD